MRPHVVDVVRFRDFIRRGIQLLSKSRHEAAYEALFLVAFFIATTLLRCLFFFNYYSFRPLSFFLSLMLFFLNIVSTSACVSQVHTFLEILSRIKTER